MRIGAPMLVIGGAVVIVFGAITGPPEMFSRPRGWQWAWVGLWLMAAGEAAFGENRPWIERSWKGAAALLIAMAVAIAVVRRHRWKAGRVEGDN